MIAFEQVSNARQRTLHQAAKTQGAGRVSVKLMSAINQLPTMESKTQSQRPVPEARVH